MKVKFHQSCRERIGKYFVGISRLMNGASWVQKLRDALVKCI